MKTAACIACLLLLSSCATVVVPVHDIPAGAVIQVSDLRNISTNPGRLEADKYVVDTKHIVGCRAKVPLKADSLIDVTDIVGPCTK